MDSRAILQKVDWKWLIIIIAIFLIAVILVGVVYYEFTKEYRDRIYPGIYVGKDNIGGLTKEEAVQTLKKRADIINQNGIIFSYLDHKTVLMTIAASPQGEVAYQLINFDLEKTVDRAYDIGRGLNALINIKNRLWDGRKNRQTSVEITINQEKIKEILTDEFSIYETPAKNAGLTYNYDKNKNKYTFNITEEKNGVVADYDSGIQQLKQNLASFDNSIIVLKSQNQYPVVYQRDCQNIEEKANAVLNKMPLILKYDGKNKTIGTNTVVEWLELVANKDSNDKIAVDLALELIKNYLKKAVSTEVDKQPQNSKFTIKNGRVTEFQTSRDGIELDVEASIVKIKEALIKNQKDVELVINTIKSEVGDDDVNELKIEEIIGTGHSNFAGSPANRRHNIKTGANTLNGMLIKPGEEFAVMKSLVPIDASTGYLPELVIKQNKTIPEYGGGLCQIGTTMFRTALASGLPITERRNHSYRVQYYEPAGTDATIYDPWPDLKFINDTDNYILIQSRIEGDNLYFDFWGKKDGREATTTYPKI